MNRRLDLVLVTFNSEISILPLLPLFQYLVRLESWEARILVVDTSCSGEIESILTQALAGYEDRLSITISPRNVGFAPAVNSALTANSDPGQDDVVVLINPDIEMATSAFMRCIDALEREADTLIVGPRMTDSKGLADRGSARRAWNLRRLLAEVSGVPTLARFLLTQPRMIKIAEPGLGEATTEVEIVSGAALFTYRRVIGDGLSTALPMYLEDQELCLRVARTEKGTVRVVRDAWALHRGAESRQSAPKSTERPLRVMELAEAPCLALAGDSKSRFLLSRLVVLLACVMRVTGGLAMGALRGTSWSRRQVVLAYWMAAWALGYRNTQPEEDLQTVFDHYQAGRK